MPQKLQKQKPLARQVLRNSLYNIALTGISRVGGLIFVIIVARLLLPELFGIYSLALAIILTIVTLAELGINQTLTRYVAEALGRKKKALARSYVRFLLRFKAIIAAFVALALFVLAKPLAVYIWHKPLIALPLQIGAVYLLATVFGSFFNSIFYAVQRVKWSAVREGIFQILRIGFVLLFLVGFKLGVPSVFVALVLALFVAVLFSYCIIYKDYRFLLKGKLVPVDRRRLLRFLGYLTIAGITMVFFASIDVLMLGAFVEAKFVGFYSAAIALVGAVAGLITVTNVLFPVFTQIQGQRLERAFKRVIRYAAMFAIPAALGLAFVARPFILVVYGSEYLQATLPLYILAFLIVEAAVGGFFGILFAAKEKPEWPTRIIIVATVLNIALNYLLISWLITIKPAYGMLGAAIATVTSRYFGFISLGILSKKKLNISPDTAAITKPLLASAVMIAFLLLFNYFVALTLFLGIVQILLAIFVYFAALAAIKGIKKEDLDLLYYLKRT